MDVALVVRTARSLFKDKLAQVSDDGFLKPRVVPGGVDGRWDGLFGHECLVIGRHAVATGDLLLRRLAEFHTGKYVRWSSRRPHLHQTEDFAEFLDRDGGAMVLCIGRRARWREVHGLAF